MADIKTEQEPSIEEILESIRQIISEDGTPVQQENQPAAGKPAPAPAPAPAAAPAPPPKAAEAPRAAVKAPAPAPTPARAAPPPPPPPPPPKLTPAPTEAPVLELTDKVEIEAEPAPTPRIVLEEIEMENAPLMSEMTEEAAVAAMSRILAQNLAVERELPGKPGPVTLEDIAREIMHPLIKAWLDRNLPVIIEKLVAREIEKLSHRAMDKIP